MEINKLFKKACEIHTQFLVYRYLMANADGRLDGCEKAKRHIELCEFYVAINFGWSDPETVQSSVSGAMDLFKEIHDKTQAKLTDHMDEAIGFPIKGTPDYCKLAPLFFDVFHSVAISIINKNEK